MSSTMRAGGSGFFSKTFGFGGAIGMLRSCENGQASPFLHCHGDRQKKGFSHVIRVEEDILQER
jgi:hypothetical protein